MPLEPVIPVRFRETLDQHLVLNYGEVSAWPLVLGVFGRPGDGKSFQIRAHLESRDVQSVSINAADLESDRAGAPGKLVLELYENAGHRLDEGGLAAVVVDDFDTTVGEWEHSTTTVNHQQVLAQLMHLADNPTEAAGRRLRRVPVFITGNDLSKVYEPLRRPGRMRAFPWLPTNSEKQEVVAHILAGALPEEDIGRLLDALPEAPVSFFAELSVELVAQASADEIRLQASNLSALAKPRGEARAALHKALSTPASDLESLTELAKDMWRARESATKSHLRG